MRIRPENVYCRDGRRRPWRRTTREDFSVTVASLAADAAMHNDAYWWGDLQADRRRALARADEDEHRRMESVGDGDDEE